MKSKKVLVTGSGTGLDRETALEFARPEQMLFCITLTASGGSEYTVSQKLNQGVPGNWV